MIQQLWRRTLRSLRRISNDKRFVSYKLLFYLALRSLLHRKLRSLLTVFGIVVGIGAIFFLVSFGLGLRNLVAEQVIGDQSIKSIDVSTPNSKILRLDDKTVNKLSSLARVEQVSKTYSFPGIVQYKGGEGDTVAYGIDSAFEKLNTFNVVAGRSLRTSDENVVVVNSAILKTWGITKASDAINKKVRLVVPLQATGAKASSLNRDFTVVGVIDTEAGSEVFVPAGIFESAGVPYYSQVKVVADETSSVQPLRKQIEGLGYQTASPIDTLDQINEVFKFFTVILIGFGAIGMIVAVLGMFNTLTISLLERTKEIGLMFALGARSGDMYRLFVFEAVLLSLAGALAGIGSALIGGVLINLGMNGFARARGVTESFQLFSYPFWLVLLMIIFMVAVGFLVVLFPARRAKRINPIDALRRE